MRDTLTQRLHALEASGVSLMAGAQTGVEKESLRVTPAGGLALSPHPEALGSALTNPFVTTDFSEALLEFVTPPAEDPAVTLAWLEDIHRFAAARIGDEFLWNASMPCRLGPSSEIPLARYGRSNVAKMKTTYRRGLGFRYGRAMQTIAGIHFNFSLPETFWAAFQAICGNDADPTAFRSAAYLSLARNFRRFGWLTLYLFGASPAVDRSFFQGRDSQLETWDEQTLYAPFATSLRMSDLGYNSSAQSRLQVSLDSLDRYIAQLTSAITTPHAEYTRIGVHDNGRWRQLNDSLLQIENEYYSSIRPKQIARSGERPTLALARRGVRYVEVRSLDVNPFVGIGIDIEQMRFLQAFLVYCVLAPSPLLDGAALDRHDGNAVRVAHSGRDPQLKLDRAGEAVLMRDWAREILDGVASVAEVLDWDERHYRDACAAQTQLLADGAATPSARLLEEMRRRGGGYHDCVLALSRSHTERLAAAPVGDASREQALVAEVAASLARQREMEQGETRTFAEHLDAYFNAQ